MENVLLSGFGRAAVNPPMESVGAAIVCIGNVTVTANARATADIPAFFLLYITYLSLFG